MAQEGTVQLGGARDAQRLLALTLELGALTLVIYYFQLESQAFFHVAVLAFGGFVVHYLLPFRYRLPFFLLLSIVAIALVFGWQATWLVGLGVVLIGVCHLPVPFPSRVATLLALAALLAVLRTGWGGVPWSPAIWPILGSMFMFRLILYAHDLRYDPTPSSVAQRLSYFFLLPNVCFPLFPVIDYRTYCRTYYSAERHHVYQVGVIWILRGLTQLILYRVVYYYFSMAPAEVEDLGDLVRYMVSGILLYLRISGQFHVIAGMLRLFGFNLPETHHLYFLSTSFTDFWRRINIYWKDFMMKIVFYPAFFRLRKRGELSALLTSTALVFAVTWVLHAYQWFWIRGSYLLAWNDVLFWLILALLVMANTVYETRFGRDRLMSSRPWTLRRAAGIVARTTGTFSVICVLWSLWTSSSVAEWLALWRVALTHPGLADARLVPAVLAGVLGFAALAVVFAVRERARIRPAPAPFGRSVSLVLASIVGVCLAGTPELYAAWLPGRVAGTYTQVVKSTREVRLSGHDQDMLERGYYEDLLSVQRFNSQLWEVYARWPVDWSRLEDTGALRLTGDFLKQELVPSTEFHFRNTRLRINRWGMRDQDYERQVPDGTFRFALLGSSHVMGYGVDDTETFDAVLERRLNVEVRDDRFRTYEILNFAVDGYNPLQELYQLETRVFDFQPHAILYAAHFGAGYRASLHLVDMVRNHVAIPYPDLQDLLQRAGVDDGVGRFEGEQRLSRFRDEIIAWTYRRIVALAREHGAVPVWVYVPQVGEQLPDGGLAAFIRTAEDAGFLAISLADAFDGHRFETIWFSPGDRHPNALGHRLLAERLYDAVLDRRTRLYGAQPPGDR